MYPFWKDLARAPPFGNIKNSSLLPWEERNLHKRQAEAEENAWRLRGLPSSEEDKEAPSPRGTPHPPSDSVNAPRVFAAWRFLAWRRSTVGVALFFLVPLLVLEGFALGGGVLSMMLDLGRMLDSFRERAHGMAVRFGDEWLALFDQSVAGVDVGEAVGTRIAEGQLILDISFWLAVAFHTAGCAVLVLALLRWFSLEGSRKLVRFAFFSLFLGPFVLLLTLPLRTAVIQPFLEGCRAYRAEGGVCSKLEGAAEAADQRAQVVTAIAEARGDDLEKVESALRSAGAGVAAELELQVLSLRATAGQVEMETRQMLSDTETALQEVHASLKEGDREGALSGLARAREVLETAPEVLQKSTEEILETIDALVSFLEALGAETAEALNDARRELMEAVSRLQSFVSLLSTAWKSAEGTTVSRVLATASATADTPLGSLAYATLFCRVCEAGALPWILGFKLALGGLGILAPLLLAVPSAAVRASKVVDFVIPGQAVTKRVRWLANFFSLLVWALSLVITQLAIGGLYSHFSFLLFLLYLVLSTEAAVKAFKRQVTVLVSACGPASLRKRRSEDLSVVAGAFLTETSGGGDSGRSLQGSCEKMRKETRGSDEHEVRLDYVDEVDETGNKKSDGREERRSRWRCCRRRGEPRPWDETLVRVARLLCLLGSGVLMAVIFTLPYVEDIVSFFWRGIAEDRQTRIIRVAIYCVGFTVNYYSIKTAGVVYFADWLIVAAVKDADNDRTVSSSAALARKRESGSEILWRSDCGENEGSGERREDCHSLCQARGGSERVGLVDVERAETSRGVSFVTPESRTKNKSPQSDKEEVARLLREFRLLLLAGPFFNPLCSSCGGGKRRGGNFKQGKEPSAEKRRAQSSYRCCQSFSFPFLSVRLAQTRRAKLPAAASSEEGSGRENRERDEETGMSAEPAPVPDPVRVESEEQKEGCATVQVENARTFPREDKGVRRSEEQRHAVDVLENSDAA
uniref:Transmembrane protein n=1 Tax=Chromera velia CCMP2878 TaxID=1169474 RepID=A0A0G4F3Z6_9ALVE|eukprot:Cvel_15042.t1-p1 / transcript=Cvel_15042.t1 / gene=Cvel_15042 / organism=Chromera_velia_CCMP2878 / gene_product=Platelet binding protein GspB, putative / transcript_product=Platelet binding protein GspB, putative / location=Cvel_scaffold1095:36847-41286(+) / protein_length=977 / sequence_SO=supercontig / SO=protein_coding / is_pseudo=false